MSDNMSDKNKNKIKIQILNFEKQYLLEELIKIFLQPDQYMLGSPDYKAEPSEELIVFNRENFGEKNSISRQIYKTLSSLTGKEPEWGILTGIRPVKLCGELYEKLGDTEKTIRFLMKEYLISEEKARIDYGNVHASESILRSRSEEFRRCLHRDSVLSHTVRILLLCIQSGAGQ